MRIKYRIDCMNTVHGNQGVVVLNGKLVYWGTLMSFSHLRNHNMAPQEPENVWIYAKKRMREAKRQMRSGLLPPKTLRLIAFLAFNRAFGTNMLIQLPPQHGWPNQYALCSGFGRYAEFYHFSVHTRTPYRPTVGHMVPIGYADNFFFDVFYDYQNQELILHDPENYNQAIDFNPEEYVRAYYQRLVDDFKRLDLIEQSVVIENTTFLTKRIDENICIGIDTNLLETGRIEKSYQYHVENALCIDGLLIQFDEDEEFSER